jgi:hypothetical protein
MEYRWPHSSRCRACGHGVGCGVRHRALEEFAPATVGVDRTQGRPFTPAAAAGAEQDFNIQREQRVGYNVLFNLHAGLTSDGVLS